MIKDEYFAGLFDGEGWFSIKRHPGHRTRSRRAWAFYATVGLVMREQHIIEALRNRFGGTVNTQRSRSQNHSVYYGWHGSGSVAKKFAAEVGPLLIAKDKHAEVILSFCEAKTLQGNRPLSDDRYAFYEECFEKMKTLNEKGIGKERNE